MIKIIVKDRNLILYFIGRFISSIGDNFLFFAQSIAAYLLTNSLAGVGVLWVVRGIASLMLIPAGGVITDRFNRKMIILSTDLLSGFISMAYVFVTNDNHYWMLPLLAFTSQSINRFSSPAINASFKNVSQKTDLEHSGAFAAVLGQIAVIVGPILASVIYLMCSGETNILFVADGISFFISFLFMNFVYFGEKPNVNCEKNHFYQDVIDGMTYLKINKPLLILIILLIPIALSGKVFEVLVLGISEMNWHFGKLGGIGIYLSIFALGGIIGASQIRKFNQLIYNHKFYALSTLLLGFIFVLMGLLDYFWSSFLLAFFVGIFSNVTVVMAQINIQKTVSNDYLGRVFSAWTFLAVTGGGIGAYFSGLFYDLFGLSFSLILFGCLIMIPYSFYFFTLFMKKGREKNKPVQ